MGAQAGNLPVIDRKGISAFWIELVCAWRVPALPPPFPIPADLRSPPGPPGRHSFRPKLSRLPFRRLRRTGPLPRQRCARGTPHPAPSPRRGKEIWLSCARVFSRRAFSPSTSFYDRRPPDLATGVWIVFAAAQIEVRTRLSSARYGAAPRLGHCRRLRAPMSSGALWGQYWRLG